MPENIMYAMLEKEELDLFSDYLSEEARSLSGRPETSFYGAFREEDELVAVLAVEERPEEAYVRIVSIGVTPSLQHQGIGSALIDYAVKEAMEAGFESLVVLLEADAQGVGELDPFFWRCGFSPEEAYPAKRILLSDLLERLGRTRAMRELDFPEISSLSETDSYLRKKLGRLLALETGYRDFSPEKTDQEISMVYSHKTDPLGCLLVSGDKEQLNLNYLFVSKECKDGSIVERLIAKAAAKAAKKYEEDCLITFSPVREGGRKLLDWFWGESAIKNETAAMVWTLPLRRETEALAVEEEAESEDGAESRFTDQGLRPVGNEELICRDCIYRLEDKAVLECHKYSTKPGFVFDGSCAFYRAESREGNA